MSAVFDKQGDSSDEVRRGVLEAAARRVLSAPGFELIELRDHGLTGKTTESLLELVAEQFAA